MQLPPPQGAGPWTPVPPWGAPSPTPTPSREVDLPALRLVRLAAIVSLVGTAVGFLSTLVGVAVRRLPLSGNQPLGVPHWAQTTIDSLLATSLIGLAFAIASLLLFRSAFVRLRPVDRRFESTPAFAATAVIGFVLLAGGLVLFFAWLGPFLDCVGNTTPLPAGCLNLSSLLGAVALLGVGGIVALVGGIGTLVGIWRLGDRYGSVLFKIGAVFLVLFGLVGSILLWVGAHSAEGAVETAPTVPPPPLGPAPPAPPPVFARPPP